MKPGRKRLLIGLFLLIAALAGILGERWLHGASRLPPSSYGGGALAELLAAPMTTPQGEMRRLSDWQGKVLVVNFWATWCPPCREEMPELSRAQDEFGANGVQFVGIAIDDTANVAEFSRTMAVSYPLLIAPAGMAGLTAKLGNQHQVLPFTVIIDRNGRQRSSHLGRLTQGDLKQQLAPLLHRPD